MGFLHLFYSYYSKFIVLLLISVEYPASLLRVRQRNFYLKKPQGIEALSMIMVLTQMVYSVAEG
jgi:hypothetical protein